VNGRRGTPREGGAFVVALVALGLALSACGVGSAAPNIASVPSSSTSTTVASAAAPSSSEALYNDELKYAQCMRTHGVPSFPDPSPRGGFTVSAGINPSSPAFVACQKLLPGGGAPGSGAPPTARALAEMLKVSQCMRRHGISDFPDPRTSIPSDRAGIGDIADRDGVILIFPAGFDDQSPEFTRAAAACSFQLTNH
jgi:hypothetical protein